MASFWQRIRRLLMVLALLATSMGHPARAAHAAPRPADIPASYQQVAENGTFQLYVDFATLGFKVRDLRSGYLWAATLDETQEGDRLNKSWTAFAASGISIEYLDQKAVNKRLSITNTAHTLDMQPIENGVRAVLTFTDVGVTVTIELQLEADGVRVAAPFDGIQQTNPDFKLGLLYLYPFLGATRGGSIPGYMLLPDGIGSIIPFAESTKAKNMFYGRYYGDDLGIIGYLPYDFTTNRAYPVSVPVFGMVHGNEEHALLSVVEKGAAYGEVQAHPAGIITNFNFIYNAFLYNQSYFQATNRSGAGVTTLQAQTNAFDAIVHFRFLTGQDANYVGLARSYQRYLLDHGLLQQRLHTGSDIDIRLEFLGGDKEKALLWSRFVPMTTISQMRAILEALDVANPQVVYYGWQPHGASTMPPLSLKLERTLGTVTELRDLAQALAARGGSLALYLNPQSGMVDEGGYSPRKDAALAITNSNLWGYIRNQNHMYFNLPAVEQRYRRLAQDVAAAGIGLALDSISTTLYSDFNKGTLQNRQQELAAYQSLLATQADGFGLYHPNDYLFGAMRAYYDMPLRDNGYIYTAQSVPFLPIVLAGYVPYFGEALNFSANITEDNLRHVDYGIYPAFFLTQEPTATMLSTSSNWIYTSSYAQWGEQIQQTYRWMNALLGPVRGQPIVSREQVTSGVFVTTYANGRQIVVNYTATPFFLNGVTVNAHDAALQQVQP